MAGLPKSYIREYGISKAAWRAYRSSKGNPKKRGKSKTQPMAKKSKTTRAKNTMNSALNRLGYNKVEKGVGSARIAERIMNIASFPPEPVKSIITTGVGFSRGGIPGGVGALLISSNLLEMGLDLIGAQFGGQQSGNSVAGGL